MNVHNLNLKNMNLKYVHQMKIIMDVKLYNVVIFQKEIVMRLMIIFQVQIKKSVSNQKKKLNRIVKKYINLVKNLTIIIVNILVGGVRISILNIQKILKGVFLKQIILIVKLKDAQN